ncbi:MAG: hypothetical protein ACOYYF_10220 [Chloroflexota bacterium]|nr:hypothetical protein [Chloroflexota bacterium]
MNTQNEHLDAVQSHCFDPFPEPQTIPSGWDVSAFNAATPSSEAEPSGESESY